MACHRTEVSTRQHGLIARRSVLDSAYNVHKLIARRSEYKGRQIEPEGGVQRGSGGLRPLRIGAPVPGSTIPELSTGHGVAGAYGVGIALYTSVQA
eukprot:2617351-Rhodomonas_salina.1